MLWNGNKEPALSWMKSATNHNSSMEGCVGPVRVSDQVGGNGHRSGALAPEGDFSGISTEISNELLDPSQGHPFL